MGMNKITSDIMEALSANKPKTQAYDTEAQVVRVEGGTAWVHIPGGVDETPVALTINASEGDTVRVRVGGGSAWIVGNDSAPPTDDKRANIAINNADVAIKNADEAYSFANTAHEMAERTDKHFFVDTDGAHVTIGDNTPNQGKNVRITNEGLEVRDNADTMAEFGADLARVGVPESSHVDIKPDQTTFYGYNGAQAGKIANTATYYQVSGEQVFLGGGSRADMLAYSNTTQSHTLAYIAVKNPNVADPMLRIRLLLENAGTGVQTAYEVSFSGNGEQAFSSFPATVSYTTSSKVVAVTFGDLSTVIPETWTSGAGITIYAYYYRATNTSNYSFGTSCSSTGQYAYSGGSGTTAAGNYSHAHGRGLYTNKPDITVVGRYNRYANDYEDGTLFAVGNGSSTSSRSDAFQVHDDGIVWSSRGSLTTFADVFGKPTSTLITNQNINTVTTPGGYVCTDGTIASTQSNPPFSDTSYQMLVFAYGGNQLFQIAWQNNLSTKIRYRVRNHNSTWGAWQQISSGSTASPIGDLPYAVAGSGSQTLGAATQTTMCEIELDVGRWAVAGHTSFYGNSTTGYRMISIGTSSEPNKYGYMCVPATAGSYVTAIETTRYITLTAKTWIYLSVTAQNQCNVNLAQTIIEAHRLT